MKTCASALAAALIMAAPAHAAILNGTFTVKAINVTNLTSAQSEATSANFTAAMDQTFAANGSASVYTTDTFTYTGDINFGTFDDAEPDPDETTIAQWFDSVVGGNGSVTGAAAIDDTDATLNDDFGALQLSKPDISNGSATSTFFMFTLYYAPAMDFTITHDDGVSVFDDGTLVPGGDVGPTPETISFVNGFDGGTLEILYVATNGDPSVLEFDAAPIPVPAALPLFLGGVGLFGIASRRRRKMA